LRLFKSVIIGYYHYEIVFLSYSG